MLFHLTLSSRRARKGRRVVVRQILFINDILYGYINNKNIVENV